MTNGDYEEFFNEPEDETGGEKKDIKNSTKKRNSLTNEDLVVIDTGNIMVMGYMIGETNGYVYLADELTLEFDDKFYIKRLIPEICLFSSGSRAISSASIVSFFNPSPLLILVYHDTIKRHAAKMKEQRDKIEAKEKEIKFVISECMQKIYDQYKKDTDNEKET